MHLRLMAVMVFVWVLCTSDAASEPQLFTHCINSEDGYGNISIKKPPSGLSWQVVDENYRLKTRVIDWAACDRDGSPWDKGKYSCIAKQVIFGVRGIEKLNQGKIKTSLPDLSKTIIDDISVNNRQVTLAVIPPASMKVAAPYPLEPPPASKQKVIIPFNKTKVVLSRKDDAQELVLVLKAHGKTQVLKLHEQDKDDHSFYECTLLWAGDIDGDGKFDAVVRSQARDIAYLHLSTGFLLLSTAAKPGELVGIAAKDFGYMQPM